MTALYRPVEITSAEQAEALPVRTPIIIGPFVAMRPDNESFWGMSYSDADYTSRELVKSFPDYDLTALVPIEAEEETRTTPEALQDGVNRMITRANRAAATGMLPPDRLTIRQQTRLVTPWEEQS